MVAENRVHALSPSRPIAPLHVAAALLGHLIILGAILLLAGQIHEIEAPEAGAIQVVIAPAPAASPSGPPASPEAPATPPQAVTPPPPLPPPAPPVPQPPPPPPPDALPAMPAPPPTPTVPPAPESAPVLPIPPVPPRVMPPRVTAATRPVPASGMPAPAMPQTTPAGVPAPSSAATVLVPPRPVAGTESDRPPAYPAMAQRRGEQGRVLLHVEVSADGRPLSVAVARSSGFDILDSAAADAVRGWRFMPATQAGRPVPATADVPVQFRLEN